MSIDRKMRVACIATVLIAGTAVADEKGFFDRIDLNEYALGVNLYTGESRYVGVDTFNIAFPAPQKYEHTFLTDDMFFIHNGNAGLRTTTDSGWRMGGLLNLQSYGYGSNNSAALVGMSRRTWTVQGGATIGRGFGPLNIDVDASADLLGVHNGFEATVEALWIFEFPRSQIVPAVSATYESADLVDYYFGVTPSEALPARPAYMPGSAITPHVRIDWDWRFHDKWYVSASAAVDFLPDEIYNSPLIDKRTATRFMLSLAYDAAAFVSPDSIDDDSIVDISISGFYARASSSIDLVGENSISIVALESAASLEKGNWSAPLDLVWQKGRYHRAELSYLTVSRRGIDASTSTSLDTQTLKLGYAFSFMRDSQKDLALFGGLHITEIEFRQNGNGETIDAATTAYMPVLGARFRASFSERFSAGATLDLFVLDFDKHSGHSIDFSVFGHYRLNERFSASGGYRYIRHDITSGDESFVGDVRIDYAGPYATITARF